MRAHDGAVSFDPNLRRSLMDPDGARRRLLPLLAQTSVLLAGSDELEWLSGRTDAADGTAWALDQGVALVVVKDGRRGARAADGTRTWSVPARAVVVADPVGAGDAFAAGLLSALLRGAGVEQALTEGAAVASLVVATPGDAEGLPDRALLDRVLASDEPVHR